jgi:hypothetical protein
MRRPKRSQLTWTPLRGVELYPETHEVTFLLSAPQKTVHLARIENAGGCELPDPATLGPARDVNAQQGAPPAPIDVGAYAIPERVTGRRFRVLIAGRRFGKTHLSCVELITTSLEHPGVIVWYVAPTWRMAKDIAWDTLKAMLPPWYRKGQPNESTLRSGS